MVWDMVCKKICPDDCKEISCAHRPKHALQKIRRICNDFPLSKRLRYTTYSTGKSLHRNSHLVIKLLANSINLNSAQYEVLQTSQ